MSIAEIKISFVVTILDFKKASDSVDRTTLIIILKLLGLDNNTTRKIFQQTLTNTTTSGNFREEISDALKSEWG